MVNLILIFRGGSACYIFFSILGVKKSKKDWRPPLDNILKNKYYNIRDKYNSRILY